MKNKTYWLYCDKWTGDPIMSPSGKLYLMQRKPSVTNVKMRGYYSSSKVITRSASIVFSDDHVVNK